MPNTDPAKKSKTKTTKKKPNNGIWANIYTAFWVHVGIIYLAIMFSDFWVPEIKNTTQHAKAKAQTQASRTQALQERVKDMEAVKAQLEQLQNSHVNKEPEQQATSSEQFTGNPQVSPTEPQQAPEPSLTDLYLESQALIEEIRQVEQEAAKQKLENLESSSEIEVKDETPSITQEIASLSEEHMAQAMVRNQREAREILQKMVQDAKRKEEGSSVKMEPELAQGEQGSESGSPSDSTFVDPNSRLAMDSYFQGVAQGTSVDLSEAMQTIYQAQQSDTFAEVIKSKSSLLAPLLRQSTPMVYSRKISAQGQPAPAVVLNSWYFLGPFPNEGRRNLHTSFPPELGVNLDAMYLGLKERVITWQHVQYQHLPLIPPDNSDFAIYYAYTQVYSDQAQDVWLAVGSDDQSKMWVNNILVWQSDDKERVWEPAQGFRKVRLKQGVNEVMFRLENGIQRAALSVVLTLSP